MSDQFINFWQHIPEKITPYIFKIGDFEFRYYGLMYIAAFMTVYLLSLYRLKKEPFNYSKDMIENLFVWIILGLMMGARLGYVLFYNLDYYSSHLSEIVLPFTFEGGFHFTGLAGMSYHGGMIGVILSSALFCRKYKINFWELGDFLAPSIPLGYTFGRIGNFINGELYGRVTDTSWGMYFPNDMTGLLRHPSQLYEAFFEGIFLFIILWGIRGIRPFSGIFISLYLIGYGTVRFFIEFVREPDPQIGLLSGYVTMGQTLCLSMILAGGILFIVRRRSLI
ncbi:MAG: prolipoprotein diacylglyceryl transferase [Nitrospira sp.]|nr:prolipoprotein diacylglyceryl transferase [Nitrospira sp.]